LKSIGWGWVASDRGTSKVGDRIIHCYKVLFSRHRSGLRLVADLDAKLVGLFVGLVWFRRVWSFPVFQSSTYYESADSVMGRWGR
jgi:hypothetical protein